MRVCIRHALCLMALLAGLGPWAAPVAHAQAPTVGFEFNGSSGPESITDVKLHVVLSAPAATPVTVHYAWTGGTATRGTTPTFGVDFIMPDGTLTFPAGSTAQDIPIQVINDAFPESNETIDVTLSSPVGATLGTIASHTYTIIDDDSGGSGGGFSTPGSGTPKVQFQTPGSSGSESDTPADLTVALDHAGTQTVTVKYAVTGGTATGGGVDYTLAPGTLSIPVGKTTASIPIAIVDDTLHEPDETIIVTLSDPQGADLGLNATHTYTIIDNDPVQVSFDDSASTAVEANQTIPIGLHLSAQSTEAVSVDFTVGGTAKGAGVDYDLNPGTVTFPPNTKNETIYLKIVDNQLVQPTPRTVVLTLTNPTSATLGDTPTHTHTIIDNDQRHILVQFATDTSKAFESVPDLKVEVDLTSPTNRPITVDYATTGTAVQGTDYNLPPGTLTFPPNQTTAYITGTIIDNTTVNPDRTISIGLANPTGALLGTPATHTHWIIDDDASTVALTLFTQDFSAAGGKVMTVVGPKALTVNPGGLAVDRAGNMYISDRGDGSAGGGSILMVPAGTREALRIITGLNDPGDVELSPDQRALVVAESDGNVSRHVLGVSVELVGGTAFSSGIVYVRGDEGTKSARISPDGYFHVEGILTPGQESATVDIIVERAGITKTFYKVPLGQAGFDGAPFGQTVVKLQF